MPYQITGIGDGPITSSKPTLEEAARTASKMIDQGVVGVRVFDEQGIEVTAAEWKRAWWCWAEASKQVQR